VKAHGGIAEFTELNGTRSTVERPPATRDVIQTSDRADDCDVGSDLGSVQVCTTRRPRRGGRAGGGEVEQEHVGRRGRAAASGLSVGDAAVTAAQHRLRLCMWSVVVVGASSTPAGGVRLRHDRVVRCGDQQGISRGRCAHGCRRTAQPEEGGGCRSGAPVVVNAGGGDSERREGGGRVRATWPDCANLATTRLGIRAPHESRSRLKERSKKLAI
jgi:hypothetical protein